MKLLFHDLNGRLVSFRVVSPQVGPVHSESKFNAGRIFAAAGDELRDFTPAEPMWTPPVATDARAAWTARTAAIPRYRRVAYRPCSHRP